METEFFQIIYTESAVRDISEKMAYIRFAFSDPDLAIKWYERLRTAIQEKLTLFPLLYPVFHTPHQTEDMIRLLSFRNDVVLFSVHKEAQTVYIWAVCTKGMDLASRLDDL